MKTRTVIPSKKSREQVEVVKRPTIEFDRCGEGIIGLEDLSRQRIANESRRGAWQSAYQTFLAAVAESKLLQYLLQTLLSEHLTTCRLKVEWSGSGRSLDLRLITHSFELIRRCAAPGVIVATDTCKVEISLGRGGIAQGSVFTQSKGAIAGNNTRSKVDLEKRQSRIVKEAATRLLAELGEFNAPTQDAVLRQLFKDAEFGPGLLRIAAEFRQSDTALGFAENREAGSFGSRLKTARKMRGWSGQKLAAEVGMHQPAIVDYEKGRRDPSTDVVLRFARALEIPPAALLPSVKS